MSQVALREARRCWPDAELLETGRLSLIYPRRFGAKGLIDGGSVTGFLAGFARNLDRRAQAPLGAHHTSLPRQLVDRRMFGADE